MAPTRSSAPLVALLAVLLVAPLVTPAVLHSHHRVRRQLADDDALQPLEEAGGEGSDAAREKRKLEPITQAKFGIKNAVLGFVFGSGSTSQGRTSHSAASSSPSHSGPESGPRRSLSGPHRPRLTRQAVTSTTPKDDIPEFDRNKVSLDFPGNLFGPSVSLLIRTTKIVGDVIQNSAERYQRFLRLFRPLFRGQFEIKGLDPPTTTTSTTSAPSDAENEVRRRRHIKH